MRSKSRRARAEPTPSIPIEQSLPTLADIRAAYELDRRETAAVERGYRTYFEHIAPFVVAVAGRMLTDFRLLAIKDPRQTFLFNGRDGHAYAAASRGLDPEFFNAHCAEVVITRMMAEAMMQDWERITGAAFPLPADYRTFRNSVDPADVPGAVERAFGYFRASGVEVGDPDHGITLVDDSLRGTVQNVLAALGVGRMTGAYAFAAPSPADPYPGTKVGYAMQLDPADWEGGPVSYLPADPRKTFIANQGLCMGSYTLEGPLDSPTVIVDGRPHQRPQSVHHVWLDPAKLREPVREMRVRNALRSAGLLAISHRATRTAADEVTRFNWTDIKRGLDPYTKNVRRWALGVQAPKGLTDLWQLWDDLVPRAPGGVHLEPAVMAASRGLARQAVRDLTDRPGTDRRLQTPYQKNRPGTVPLYYQPPHNRSIGDDANQSQYDKDRSQGL